MFVLVGEIFFVCVRLAVITFVQWNAIQPSLYFADDLNVTSSKLFTFKVFTLQ